MSASGCGIRPFLQDARRATRTTGDIGVARQRMPAPYRPAGMPVLVPVHSRSGGWACWFGRGNLQATGWAACLDACPAAGSPSRWYTLARGTLSVCGGRGCTLAAVVQCRDHAAAPAPQATPSGAAPKKIDLIAKGTLSPVSAIKLIRTDTTLDLSQKAEKGTTSASAGSNSKPQAIV